MNWYYVEAGQQMGPVDDAGLNALVSSGKISPDTLVWREGMANWQAYREVQSGGGGLRINRGPAAGSPAVAGAATEGEVVCAECGNLFPASETIQISGARVCANCKPISVQKMREGLNVGAAGSFRYAGFWIRFAAVFLDGIILNIVNIAIRVAFGLGITGAFSANSGGSNTAAVSVTYLIVALLQILIAVGYETFMIGQYGATLGKMACKIHVVVADGSKVGFGRSLGRYLSKIVSAFICMIGYLMAGWDGEKRALHDRMCNTRVVYNN